MLPLGLLLWILGEMAGWQAIGHGLLGTNGWRTGLFVVAGMLGLRAGLNALTWIFARHYASPAPRLGPWQSLRLVLGEYLAYLLTFLLVLPLERLWMPADLIPPGSKRVILLVHGYGCSRGVWWLLRRRLEAAGWTVATISLVPPWISMGRMVPQLQERIETVCRETGCQQLSLLAHSMGGLVCRSYLARHGNKRVTALLTLATPHAGSELARYAGGQNAREMAPGSLWLRDLAGDVVDVPAIAFRNPYDNYVMPQDNQRLAGAQDRALPPVGHLAMLYDRRVAQQVNDACNNPREQR